MHVNVASLHLPSFPLSRYLFTTLCTSHLRLSPRPSFSFSNISKPLFHFHLSLSPFSVRVAPPPLFSLSAVWNAVLSIVLPCNCDTSSSVGLAVRSPYLLRLHSVSPSTISPRGTADPPHPTPFLATPILLTSIASHPLVLGKHAGLTFAPLPHLFCGKACMQS